MIEDVVRKAFKDIHKDKEFLAEAEKGKFTLDPALLARLKEILFK
jgi:hypothetical protein